MRINKPHPKEWLNSIQYRKTVSYLRQGVCNVGKTGPTRGLSSASRADQNDQKHLQPTGSSRLGQCWAVSITTTTGKRRDALDKEEVSPKQPVTEAGIRVLKAASVLPTANSHR